MLDVAIIGGGVCGCSLLYALCGYGLQVGLFEKTNDVGVATTKANSAIVHAGYDPAPGTLMAKYNAPGNALVRQLARDLDILMLDCGSLVVAFDEAERPHIEQLYRRGLQNGVPGLRIAEREELRAIEPHLSESAVCALHAPTGAVINPWELAFAQAEVAVQNGARVWLSCEVTGIAKTIGPGGGHFTLQTTGGAVQARFVVNAAGVAAGQVAALAGAEELHIAPSRGQYFLLDKNQSHLANSVIFQCPTALGKGVLVAPTVHGNLIVGPNAEPAASTDTTAEGLAMVKRQALKSVPDIDFSQNIRNFAGLRAVSATGDFVVGQSRRQPGFFSMAGILSPGLTSAPAIAADMVRMLAEAGLTLPEKPHVVATRRVKRFNHMTPAQRAEAIAENPLYGRIVCRCESVTEGEIADALRRPLPPKSLDAVKRRCGCGMGRCQGGFCGPRVQAIIARELGIAQADVPQDREGMDIIIHN